MLDELRALDQALSGRADTAPLLARLRAGMEHAEAIHSFSVRPDRDGPFHHVSFGPVPVIPVGPMFASFAALRSALGSSPAARAFAALLDAVEERQRQWIWEADCQEQIDANGTCALYLYAAGQLDALEATLGALAALLA